MKKTINIIAVFLTFSVFAGLCSCSVETNVGTSSSAVPLDETSSEIAEIPTSLPPSTTEAGASETVTNVPTEIEILTTSGPETSAADPSGEGPVVVGITKKGYEIIEINGVTYINGVLVVNKTYSLPQSYGPGNLTPECKEAFSYLVSAAAQDGLNIFVASGYRSYSTQAGLYSRYCARDGQERADTYSARPGHSEHQTGLAIDVNSVSYSFANTPEGQWIAANSYKYGFIVRYGQDKQGITGYAYEPWHIRYVGVAMAQAIYDSGLCLEEYLGIDSVYS